MAMREVFLERGPYGWYRIDALTGRYVAGPLYTDTDLNVVIAGAAIAKAAAACATENGWREGEAHRYRAARRAWRGRERLAASLTRQAVRDAREVFSDIANRVALAKLKERRERRALLRAALARERARAVARWDVYHRPQREPMTWRSRDGGVPPPWMESWAWRTPPHEWSLLVAPESGGHR